MADLRGDMGTAMAVPLAFFVVAWSYALAVNFAPRYTKVVDAFTATEVGVRGGDVDPENPEKPRISIEETEAKTATPTVQ